MSQSGNNQCAAPDMTDEQLFERIFWQIFEDDFPLHREAFAKLLPAGLNAINGKVPQHFDRVCSWFFSENTVAWPRYDAYLAYWNEADPRIELEEDEDEPDDFAMPPGKLLAHRIVMSFYAEQRRQYFLNNSEFAPYWKLVVIEDGRDYPECVQESKAAHRFDSAYWNKKKLPCERLYCRCRLTAWTEGQLNLDELS